MRVFSFVEVEGEDAEQPGEEVDLIELAKGKATRDER